MKSHKKYLDVKTLSKLGNAKLVAKLVVEGFISGMHESPFQGFNVEFAEHRQYMQGDEIKNIDWKVFAKSDRYYVKQFQEDTNMRVLLLLDVSNSMNFGTTGITKLDFSKYLAASISYLMLRQQDSAGLVTFSDSIRKYIAPRASMSHFNVILDELEKPAENTEDTSISNTLHEIAERMNRRGLVIIISDFLDDPEEVLRGLKHLRHKKHEVIVCQVLDDSEIDFPFKGHTEFKGLENEGSLLADASEIAAEYRYMIEDFIQTYRRGCLGNYMDYMLMRTGTGYDQALFDYLGKRKAL